jgi:excisionase family DNA binding protein
MEDKLLTVKDVMKKLQISRQTLYNHTKEGKIKSVKIGSLVRYEESEVSRFIQSQQPETV